MHAQGEEQADGIRAYSCIGVVLQDYSNGTGDKTVRVTANLSPGFFPFVLSRMQNDLDRFDFTEDKIFGEPDEHGLSTVTKLSVKRASVGTDGKPRNYPWCVIVENGRAVKEKTATGGTHIKSGTYKKQRSVYVNINDLDFFNLVYRTTRFIESWELTYGPKLIRDARKLLSEQRAAAQQYDDAFNKSFFIEEDRIYAFGPNRDRKSKLQTEESKALELVTDYPVKSWYPSFEAYCNEHRGFVKVSDGRWGYTCNHNAKWDWWQIGGRFPNRFLVPEGLQDCIPSAKGDDGESAIPPEGYQYPDGVLHALRWAE